MEKISPCRCGSAPLFTPYEQSIDGNHDMPASVTCRTCGRKTVMGWDLWREVEDEVGDEKYDGHTAYLSKRFIEALGDATIRKWNRENGGESRVYVPERTCRMVSAFDTDELEHEQENISFSPEDTLAYRCDGCGFDFRYERGLYPSYCPNCGAKVVSE